MRERTRVIREREKRRGISARAIVAAGSWELTATKGDEMTMGIQPGHSEFDGSVVRKTVSAARRDRLCEIGSSFARSQRLIEEDSRDIDLARSIREET